MKHTLIKSKSYMICGEAVKLVICTRRPVYEAYVTIGSDKYADAFNDEEPYDRKSHIFFFPKNQVNEATVISLHLKRFKHGFITRNYEFVFGTPEFADDKSLLSEYDSALSSVKTEDSRISDGVTYSHTLYADKNKAPVHVFTLEVDPKYASIYVGTPSDSYESRNVRATIPDMIAAAERNGKKIVGAVNADFFDIFGDFHPSGLCVKNGKIVANGNSKRNFFAVLKDGRHIITNLSESPDIIKDILHAASGLQMIVKGGKVFDYAPLEPFSFVRHPRTSVGVKKDGTVILMVVDGRIPDYSNGASLVDLAKLMISFGADRAINLDGGGSSALYTNKNGRLILHSRPADLFRPKARLIRKDFNSLLVEVK